MRFETALAGLAMFVVAGAASAGPYRLFTYNVQFRPAVTNVADNTNEDIYGMPDEDRARRISERIIALGPDVVALQEVFVKEAFEVFVEELRGTYPHHTERDDLWDFETQGSGMLLFSRFPMERLEPLPDGQRCMKTDAGGACLAASLEFREQVTLHERQTRKTIAYVRLANPRTGRPLHVFFTHLQSGRREDKVAARAAQVAEAGEFIKHWTGDAGAEEVALLGDLNIVAPAPGEEAGEAEEYDQHVAGTFAGEGLEDAWLAGSPDDAGFTFDGPATTASDSGGQQRIDYVLVRAPQTPGGGPGRCFQHGTVERERFRVDELVGGQEVVRDLSDHFAVMQLVGAEAPHCDPRRAVPLGLGEHQVPGQIAAPGNVQWFLFREGGTYTVKAEAAGSRPSPMRVAAYAATDLSTPLAAVEGSGILEDGRARVVFDSRGPFYVKVDATNPSWTGAYTFTAREHRGASFDDAIFLDASEALAQLQMQAGTLSPLDRVHYQIQQRALDSGRPQRLGFVTLGGPAPLRIQAFDAARQPFPGLETPPAAGLNRLDVSPPASPISGAAQRLFFTVDRESCPGCPATYAVLWESDYRQLDFGELTVVHQTEGFGHLGYDEVRVTLSVDGEPEREVFHGHLDQATATRLNHRRPVGFAREVVVRIVELDGVTADDTFPAARLEFHPDQEGIRQVTDFHADGGAALGHYVLDWLMRR
jgi:endonuclease/exonuclease/phosphatase family metal-dependent hydrolase